MLVAAKISTVVTTSSIVRRKSNVSIESCDVLHPPKICRDSKGNEAKCLKAVLVVCTSTIRKSHHCCQVAVLVKGSEALSQYTGSWNTVALFKSLGSISFKNLM